MSKREIIDLIINKKVINRLKNFFNIEDISIIENLLSIMKLETHSKNKLLFKENDISKGKLYIILEGSIGISKFLKKDEIFDKNVIYIKNIFLGYFIRKLEKFNMFGKISLLMPDLKRTASSFTLENSKLLTLEKKDFDIVLNSKSSNLNFNKKNFLSNVFNFENYNHILELVLYMSEVEIYKKNKIIISKCQKIKKLYFIYSGVIEFFEKNLKFKFLNKNIYIKQLIQFQSFGEAIFFEANPISDYYIYVKSSEVILLSLDIENIKKFPEIEVFFSKYYFNIVKKKKLYLQLNKNKLLKNISNFKLKNNSKTKNVNNKLRIFFNKNDKYLKRKSRSIAPISSKIVLFHTKKPIKSYSKKSHKAFKSNQFFLLKKKLVKKFINRKNIPITNSNYINIIQKIKKKIV